MADKTKLQVVFDITTTVSGLDSISNNAFKRFFNIERLGNIIFQSVVLTMDNKLLEGRHAM